MNITQENKFKQLLESENIRALGIFLISLGIFLSLWEIGANMELFFPRNAHRFFNPKRVMVVDYQSFFLTMALMIWVLVGTY